DYYCCSYTTRSIFLF
nr:immunoglobulin light chain junction region [Macaca mulatta]MOY16592.1 immunoglobulin light chain junction region [Macaca mulatta]MOY17351.1 immunoglobulin light chain junction region [Macaca mulatta]